MGTNGEFEPVGIDTRKNKSVIDDPDQKSTDYRAKNRADASIERNAPDHCARYGLQF